MCKDISQISNARRASVRSLVIKVAKSILRTQGKKVERLTFAEALKIVEEDKALSMVG